MFVVLFPQLVYLAAIRTRVYLPNVFLFIVLGFPRLVCLATGRTGFYCPHTSLVSFSSINESWERKPEC